MSHHIFSSIDVDALSLTSRTRLVDGETSSLRSAGPDRSYSKRKGRENAATSFEAQVLRRDTTRDAGDVTARKNACNGVKGTKKKNWARYASGTSGWRPSLDTNASSAVPSSPSGNKNQIRDSEPFGGASCPARATNNILRELRHKISRPAALLRSKSLGTRKGSSGKQVWSSIARAQFQAGVVYYKSGELERAEPFFHNVLRICASLTDEDAYEYAYVIAANQMLGNIAEQMGRDDEAKAHFKCVLKTPRNEGATMQVSWERNDQTANDEVTDFRNTSRAIGADSIPGTRVGEAQSVDNGCQTETNNGIDQIINSTSCGSSVPPRKKGEDFSASWKPFEENSTDATPNKSFQASEPESKDTDCSAQNPGELRPVKPDYSVDPFASSLNNVMAGEGEELTSKRGSYKEKSFGAFDLGVSSPETSRLTVNAEEDESSIGDGSESSTESFVRALEADFDAFIHKGQQNTVARDGRGANESVFERSGETSKASENNADDTPPWVRLQNIRTKAVSEGQKGKCINPTSSTKTPDLSIPYEMVRTGRTTTDFRNAKVDKVRKKTVRFALDCTEEPIPDSPLKKEHKSSKDEDVPVAQCEVRLNTPDLQAMFPGMLPSAPADHNVRIDSKSRDDIPTPLNPHGAPNIANADVAVIKDTMCVADGDCGGSDSSFNYAGKDVNVRRTEAGGCIKTTNAQLRSKSHESLGSTPTMEEKQVASACSSGRSRHVKTHRVEDRRRQEFESDTSPGSVIDFDRYVNKLQGVTVDLPDENAAGKYSDDDTIDDEEEELLVLTPQKDPRWFRLQGNVKSTGVSNQKTLGLNVLLDPTLKNLSGSQKDTNSSSLSSLLEDVTSDGPKRRVGGPVGSDRSQLVANQASSHDATGTSSRLIDCREGRSNSSRIVTTHKTVTSSKIFTLETRSDKFKDTLPDDRSASDVESDSTSWFLRNRSMREMEASTGVHVKKRDDGMTSQLDNGPLDDNTSVPHGVSSLVKEWFAPYVETMDKHVKDVLPK